MPPRLNSAKAHLLIFVNTAKGISTLQLRWDLDGSYKSAFMLTYKLKDVKSSEMKGATVAGPGKWLRLTAAISAGTSALFAPLRAGPEFLAIPDPSKAYFQ